MKLLEDLTLGLATTENPIGLIERSLESLQESSMDGMDASQAVAAYEIPISRYDFKNGNGRNYSKKLWEMVIANQRAVYLGSVGFANHPETKENMKDLCIVWGDGRIKDDGYIWWDAYFVGTIGEMFHQALRVGAKIGISSVGDGDLDTNGNVIPESYKILRPGDIVYKPSQTVYAKKSHVKEGMMEEIVPQIVDPKPEINAEKPDASNIEVVSAVTLRRLVEILDCKEEEIVAKVSKMKEIILKKLS